MAVDQQKRKLFLRNKIKSFDFIVYPRYSSPVIAEIKGRKFKGKTLTKMGGLQSWVTMDDVRGLMRWEQVFGASSVGVDNEFEAFFIFAYKFEKIDVETAGKDVYDFEQNRYVFYAIRLDDYRSSMRTRSPKWQTTDLPAKTFKEFVVPVQELLLKE